MNPYEFFQFFYVFQNTVFEKIIKAITVQVLIWLPEKLLDVLWNRGIKTYTKFVGLRRGMFILQMFQRRKKKLKKFNWILKNQ